MCSDVPRSRGVAAAIMLALTLGSGAAAEGQPCPTVSRVARSVSPGELVLLTVACAAPLQKVEVTAFGRSIPFYEGRVPGAWQGLVGIDLNTKPGVHAVTIVARAGASTFTRTYTLSVSTKRFRTRQLKVPPQFVTPPESVRARIEQEAKRVSAIMATITPARLWEGPFVPPVPGPMISPFGTLSVLNGTPGSRHAGADFQGAEGTPIQAPAAGQVMLAADLYFSGRTVIIDHGLGLISLLAHLSEIRVREGDPVARGEEVGTVGSTGRVTGPHLHWTVRVVGARVDPMSLLAVLGPSGGRLP
jgi:murein DD-endopeptidase MepM/ murein hydrolase activator NlpD